jgi:hypothetical protein
MDAKEVMIFRIVIFDGTLILIEIKLIYISISVEIGR